MTGSQNLKSQDLKLAGGVPRLIVHCLIAHCRVCVLGLVFVVLSGCVSTNTGGAAGPSVKAPGVNPHYKVGNPYTIDGRLYYPAVDPSYKEIGVSSWYGPKFHGKPTANGELFDRGAMTAAHRTLPLPSIVEVKNLENGRVVRVRVNDRGPFAKDRIIDLSEEAARRLGFLEQGIAQVEVTYIKEASLELALTRLGDRSGWQALESEFNTASFGGLNTNVVDRTNKHRDLRSLIAASQEADHATSPIGSLRDLDNANAQPQTVASGQIRIQVGAFSSRQHAERLGQKIAAWGPVFYQSAQSNRGNIIHKVMMGPYTDDATAQGQLLTLQQAGYQDAWILKEAK